MKTRKHLFATGSVVAIVGAAYAGFQTLREPSPMTALQARSIETLSAQAHQRCLGSHVMTVPDGFTLNPTSILRIDQIALTVAPESQTAFQRRFDDRHAELASRQQIGKAAHPHLRDVTPLPTGGIFDRADTHATSSRARRTLELWAWKDGFTIRADATALDNTFPEDASNAFLQDVGNEVPRRQAALQALLPRVSGRHDTEIPSGPGVCIANGFIAGQVPPTTQVHIAYHLKDTPDVFVAFNQWHDRREHTAFLERYQEIKAMMALGGTRTLRKGRVTIGLDNYDTLLVEAPTPDGVMGTTLTLHGNDSRASSAASLFELTLFNGLRIPEVDPRLGLDLPPAPDLASLSAAQALTLWDGMIDTLQPRPGRE